jgi:uncharacterized membrane-anchored protein
MEFALSAMKKQPDDSKRRLHASGAVEEGYRHLCNLSKRLNPLTIQVLSRKLKVVLIRGYCPTPVLKHQSQERRP